MSLSPALPLLSLLLLLPALGSLLAFLIGEARVGLRRAVALAASGSTLALALGLGLWFDPGGSPVQFEEIRPWIPPFGVSYELGLDGWSSALVLWVALLTPLALASGDGLDRRTTGMILLLECALFGLFVARDVLLLMSFYGFGLLVSTFLVVDERARRRYFGYQVAGLTVTASFVLVCYHLAAVQAGFSSTRLSRWGGLVLYPDTATALFYLGAAGALVALPLVPLASWLRGTLTGPPVAARLLLLGGWSLVGSYLLVRLVGPVVPGASSRASGLVLVLASFATYYAVLTPRRGPRSMGWAPLVWGYQALVLVGLFSSRTAGVVAGQVEMLHLASGFSAIALWSSRERTPDAPPPWPARVIFGAVLLALIVLPGPFGVLAAQWQHSPLTTTVVALGFVFMTFRLLRSAPSAFRSPGRKWRRRALLVVPIVAWGASLHLAPGAWRLRLAPSARAFLGPASGGASAEVDP